MKLITGTIWTDKKRTFLGLPLSFTRYMATSSKLVTRIGFFTIREPEIELYKVTDKSISFPFLQRLFGCGTIHLSSTDDHTPEVDIKCVKNARWVYEQLEMLINAQKDLYAIRGRDMMGSAGTRTDDIPCLKD